MPKSRPSRPVLQSAPRRRAARAIAAVLPVVDVLVRGLTLWLLFTVGLALSGWAGHTALQPGAWLDADIAWYRALNGLQNWPLTSALFTALNDPGPAYFAVIVVLLGYCAWRRRAYLPAAALAIGVSLGLGQVATKEIHHAGHRERPFVRVLEAQTPVMSCRGPRLVALRDAAGPTAACDSRPEGAAAATAAAGATSAGAATAAAEDALDDAPETVTAAGDVADAAGAATAGAPAGRVAPVEGVEGVDWRQVWTQYPSFPSGHLRETAALCLLLVAFWPASWPLALTYTLVMAFSRVHLGAHYPSDVLAGTAIGLWSSALTLLGLDLARRLALVLYRVPAIRRAWDWVARPRVPGRADLDPAPARAIRIAALMPVAVLTLYGLGYATTDTNAGQVFGVMQNVDLSAFLSVTQGFDPTTAPAVYWSLGQGGPLYAALALLSLASRWRSGRAAPVRWAVTVAAALVLGLALHWLGTQFFQRPQPFTQAEEIAVPPEWQAPWTAPSTFPNRHALIAAALAGSVAGRWLSLAAHVLALSAAVTAVYFGAAWASDALSGAIMGAVAGAIARYGAGQIFPPEPATAPSTDAANPVASPAPPAASAPGPVSGRRRRRRRGPRAGEDVPVARARA